MKNEFGEGYGTKYSFCNHFPTLVIGNIEIGLPSN